MCIKHNQTHQNASICVESPLIPIYSEFFQYSIIRENESLLENERSFFLVVSNPLLICNKSKYTIGNLIIYHHVMQLLGPSIVKNYKISAYINCVKQDLLHKLKKDVTVKCYGNFFVWRKGSFVYIIFPCANYVNITGIRSKRKLHCSFRKFEDKFQLKNSLTFKQIDNITTCSSINNFKNINYFRKKLLDLNDKFEKRFYSLKFNSNYFPAIYLKLRDKGTFIIFNSGKFNLVGFNSIIEIKRQLCKFRQILALSKPP